MLRALRGFWYRAFYFNVKTERERARLERIVIEQQRELKRLENANDRLKVQLEERGKLNVELNRRAQTAERRLRALTPEQQQIVGPENI